MNPKLARTSFGEPFACLKPWPEDVFVQCGSSGLVLGKDPYRTAFFEAFPKNPSTFLRGEGKTIEDAEASCFEKYEKILACDEHDYARHGEEHGRCKKCGLFTSYCFPPEAACVVCGKEHVNFDVEGKKLCFAHYRNAIDEVVSNYFKTNEDNPDLDAIDDVPSRLQAYRMETYISDRIEYDILMANSLLDTSVDFKIKRYKDDIDQIFSNAKRTVDKHIMDIYKEEEPKMNFWKLTAAMERAESEQNIHSLLYRWSLVGINLIKDDTVNDDVALGQYLDKVEWCLKNPPESE